MARIFHIALFSLIGFILTPADTYACGEKSDKIQISSHKKFDSEIEKKDCCNKEKEKCGNHGNDCGGKCKNPTCHCPTSISNSTLLLFTDFSPRKFIESKPDFYYQETYYSSDFMSIWQPPKIG